MNFDVALANMHMIAKMGRQGFLDGIGVSKAEFDRLVGEEPWLSTDRNRMTAVLHSVVNASLDAMGLPRFTLPAEFIAAGIAVFVAPINALPACIFAPPSPTADALGRMATVAPCTSEQLFALVVQLVGHPGRNQARALFEKNAGIALDKATAGVRKAVA